MLSLAAGAATADTVPPPEIARLLEAPPPPTLSEDPQGRFLLLVHERELLPPESLAEPALSVLGLKINPRTYGRHAPIAYYGLTLVDVASGRQTPVEVPRDATIGFPIWSPDGSRFAFTATRDDGIELWVGNPADGRVHKVVGPELNATLSAPCTFMPDNRRLLCRLIDGTTRAAPPPDVADPMAKLTGPTLLRSVWQEQAVDPWTIQRYVESRLTLIDADTGLARPIGPRAAIDGAEPAPSGAYLLVSRFLPPYPQVAGVSEPSKTIEVWDRFGNIVRSFPAAAGARAVQWHASQPATLAWVERRDGGDRVVVQHPPYTEAPVEIFGSAHRYAGLDWLEGRSDVLISEYDASRRVKRVWSVATDGTRPPQLVGESSVDSAFPELGAPVHKTNRWGKQVVAVHDGGIFVRGDAPAPSGIKAYLDHVRLDTLESNRLWESDGRSNEKIVGMLTPDGGALLTRRETSREPPNYFVRGAESGFAKRVTHFEHPAEGLQNAYRVPLRYERHDGYGLSANLYLPARNDTVEPLPLIIWAYPRVYGSDTQSIAAAAPERFPDFERAFKLFFLLQGYAVLDDVSMPIIGDGANVNDTFIEQVVANASAAIRAAEKTGFVDPKRVGVAGHSYGAFMVANLLAHSDLFEAGVALSGAYNRTLTPFGFQTERRSLWEARETYLEMSPFMHSNSIREPLLLVHGLMDENAGTPPIQSITFFEAIRHNGGNADILLLPREGHSYRGRDSVLATAAAMLEFFDRNLKKAGREEAPQVLRAATFDAPAQGGAQLAR